MASKKNRLPQRAARHLERRVASIASKHVAPEFVDGAIRSVARALTQGIPDPKVLDSIPADEVTDALIDEHMRWHATIERPKRALAPVAPTPAIAPLDSGIRRNPTEQLATRQDAAARSGERK